ncbi:amino acid transporter heavy chain SLC3A2-like isoform X1 [Anguilla rostrata]|uniref:amino acid transporter heavy chain SLC3A2-like isoform X1 n=1 Tax=Anguilla rostrata TaxID=7938 RepID=UPI0030CEF879
MSKDLDVEMKDVELNEVDQEKQPMTDGEAGNGDGISPTSTEKNGIVKVKIPEDGTAVKFTGLSKEELLKVAGTPGWVRTRWALLVLFWLGWLGMLAGAVAIIVQAPRCKPLPKMNWWNEGPLYQIGDVAAFTGGNTLKGLAEKMESLSQLKVKGLVLGPIHVSNMDQSDSLSFTEIAPGVGTLEEFKFLIKTAQKKNIAVVLDLTPNYRGREPWFANGSVTDVAEKLKPALVYWLKEGVDGVQLSGVERLVTVVPSQWADIRAIVQNGTTDGKEKALFGVTEQGSVAEVSRLLNSSGVDLLMSGVLRSSLTGVDRAEALQHLYAQNQMSVAWTMGDRRHGHLASLVSPNMLALNQMLLFTLPGTPVFNYGDEIGLEDEQENKFPKMLWDTANAANSTEKDRESIRSFFQKLSELRGKERSLLYGSFRVLHNSTSCLGYLRQWDQSAGYLAAFNWGEESASLSLAHASLPATATVTLSTDTAAFPKDSSVKLAALELGSGQAVLLQYPYTA